MYVVLLPQHGTSPRLHRSISQFIWSSSLEWQQSSMRGKEARGRKSMFLYSSSLFSASPALLTDLIILLCHKYASSFFLRKEKKKNNKPGLQKWKNLRGKRKKKRTVELMSPCKLLGNPSLAPRIIPVIAFCESRSRKLLSVFHCSVKR